MDEQEKKYYYLDQIKQIEDFVRTEESTYKMLTPKRKITLISKQIKTYCERNNSANRYKILERKNPKYESLRIKSEYFEMLAQARIKSIIKILDDDELELLVLHLKNKVQEGLGEDSVKKRFQIQEYVNYACLFAKVENVQIKNELTQIKKDSLQIIRDIPTM